MTSDSLAVEAESLQTENAGSLAGSGQPCSEQAASEPAGSEAISNISVSHEIISRKFSQDPHQHTYDQAAEAVVELGNRLIDEDDSADVWDVAAGMMAGAVQYWLFARQPCSNPSCDACTEVADAQARMRVLLAEVQQLAEDSDFYDSEQDTHVGNA